MQNIYGLKSKTIDDIIAVISSFPEVQKAELYGSRAKGNYKNDSDIDITLHGEKLTLKTLNQISESLENLYLPQTFDLSIFHQIDNPDLLEHILRNGKVLYIKP
jgi:predicted nucleotidyltransferase